MILSGPGALSVSLVAVDPPVLLERSALEEALLTLAGQIAETQPRGPGLSLSVAPEAAEGRLTLWLPAGLAPPALEAAATVFRTAGGSVTQAAAPTGEPAGEPAGGSELVLSLPRHVAG